MPTLQQQQNATLRFAPSPNGLLHLGHARSALLNERLARQLGGKLLLRLEDIDLARCSDSLAKAMLEDLGWLGVQWSGTVRRQSEHFDDYERVLNELRERGLIYPCFASRREIAKAVSDAENMSGRPWPRDPDGAPVHPLSGGRLSFEDIRLRMERGEPFAWRLDMQKAIAAAAFQQTPLTFPAFTPVSLASRGEGGEEVAAHPARWGDVVLARKDTPTSYHLSVVVDDALQGVTHVVRGEDLLAATDIHRLLQALLGLPVPLYYHHDLVRDEFGEKLAKSRASVSLRELRESGWTPDMARRAACGESYVCPEI